VISFSHEGVDFTIVSSLDTVNGGLKWENDTTPNAPLRRHLRTKKWIAPMLNDTKRNQFYHQAINKAVKAAVEKKKEKKKSETASQTASPSSPHPNDTPVTVLDVGTGSGLLALLSASSSPRVNVTALEMSTPMSTLASKIISTTTLSSRITLLNTHSNNIQPSPTAPDICTSELLDYQLIGEGILPCLRDLYKRGVINDDTIVLPARARVYAQLIGGGFIDRYYGRGKGKWGGVDLCMSNVKGKQRIGGE
jgi:protein arginine N-methyltransferase 7